MVIQSKNRMARVFAAILSLTLLTATMATMGAQADPVSDNAFIGVGSDTIQDVGNAWSGFTNATYYLPVNFGAATLKSYDATDPVGVSPCLATKLGGPTFDRPNGSTSGRRALSRAIDGTGWGSAACGGLKAVSGQIDFARSSAGPSGAGTDLTYIPVGRDAMSFAYFKAGAGAVTTLTRAQLTSLFTGTGPQIINGVRVLPCGIQLGSGTFAFWQTVTTASAAAEATATAECNALVSSPSTAGRAQENDGDALVARGLAAEAAVPGTQVVIGFSAGAFIAKSNGAAPGGMPATALMGSISNDGAGNNLGLPIVGTAPNLTPAAAFYANTVFGRTVYIVVPTAKIDSLFGNTALKGLFKGSTSAICLASTQVTTNKFGFLTAVNCGDTSLKGPLITGTL